jgi:hypothetical protein
MATSTDTEAEMNYKAIYSYAWDLAGVGAGAGAPRGARQAGH